MAYKKIMWSDADALELLTQTLHAGKLVVGTSDTVIGFLADTTKEGFTALNHIKKRSEKPYLILIGSRVAFNYFAQEPHHPLLHQLLAACWPGPLTVIVKARAGLPPYLCGSDGTVAVRFPDHAGLQALLHSFTGLFSTSANLTGNPVPVTLEELDPSLSAQVEILVDDAIPVAPALPSTIVDATGSALHIVREGVYTHAQLAKFLG